MSENFTRTFVYEKSTPNKHRFTEIVPQGAGEAIGKLYIDKNVCPKDIKERNLQVRVDFLTQADQEALLATEDEANG